MEGLRELQAEYPVIGDVRGVGLMVATTNKPYATLKRQQPDGADGNGRAASLPAPQPAPAHLRQLRQRHPLDSAAGGSAYWVAEYGDVWTTQPGDYYVEGHGPFYRKSPGMVTKEISILSNARENFRFQITSLEPKNPENAPDAFEMEALHKFEISPATYSQIELIDGQRYYRRMAPLFTQASCLECHPGEQIGSVRGGISVLLPMAEVDQSLADGRQALVTTAVIITALMTSLLYLMVRQMVAQPLSQLRGAAAALGQGDYAARSNLQTGDELQALGETFNQMADSVRQSQESLQAQIAQRSRELNALAEMALTISRSQNLQPVLSEALAQALSAAEMDSGTIDLYGPSGGVILTVRQGETSRAADDYRGAIAAPLYSGQRELGQLTLRRREETAVSPEQRQFITCLANQLGVAVANAHFQEEIERLAILEERGRIARELHDSLAQTLSWLHLKMDMLTQTIEAGDISQTRREAQDAREVVDQACFEVRESIDGLRIQPEAGLDAAVASYVHEFSRRSGLPVALTIEPDCQLTPLVEIEALRILQEGLTNAYKHARASRLEVALRRRNGHVELKVSDDGRGFDPQTLTGDGHYGLRIMRERAERVAGSFQVEAAPGAGATLIARLPAEQRAAALAMRV
jgi:two-component system, NarL family, nitrate/nitrite sensor histidine kinase NarX